MWIRVLTHSLLIIVTGRLEFWVILLDPTQNIDIYIKTKEKYRKKHGRENGEKQRHLFPICSSGRVNLAEILETEEVLKKINKCKLNKSCGFYLNSKNRYLR